MVDLLIHDENAPADIETRAVTSFAGAPAVPAGTQLEWPACADCAQPMGFVAKVTDPHAPADAPRLVLLFQCSGLESLGACETWEAEAGANAAYLVPAAEPLVPLAPPTEVGTRLGPAYGVEVRHVDVTVPDRLSTEYDVGREQVSGRRVVGSLGGVPGWIQGDDTPTCASCAAPMAFVAHLEEGVDHAHAANFGGGVGFLFSCTCAQPTARFVWQQ